MHPYELQAQQRMVCLQELDTRVALRFCERLCHLVQQQRKGLRWTCTSKLDQPNQQ